MQEKEESKIKLEISGGEAGENSAGASDLVDKSLAGGFRKSYSNTDAVSAKDEADRSGSQKKKQPPALPFNEAIFAIVLFVLAAVVGPGLNSFHMYTLDRLGFRNPRAFDMHIKYAESLKPALCMEVLRAYDSECGKQFGYSNPSTIMARLIYLRYRLGMAEQDPNTFKQAVKEANSIDWRSRLLPVIDHPESCPESTTNELYKLAEFFFHQAFDNDPGENRSPETIKSYNSASFIFEVVLSRWDKWPANATITNVKSDYAECRAGLGDYQNAAKYMKQALDITWQNGAYQYNVYRAERLANYYRHLNQIDLSIRYAQDAVTMGKALSTDDYFYKAACRELALSKNQKNQKQKKIESKTSNMQEAN